MKVTDQAVDFIAGGVDIALRFGDPPPGYVARPFMEGRGLPVGGCGYLDDEVRKTADHCHFLVV